MCDNSEAVVWCSNHHHYFGGTYEKELTYASRVLDDMPFAELYMGSSIIMSSTEKDKGNSRRNGADEIGNGGSTSIFGETQNNSKH